MQIRREQGLFAVCALLGLWLWSQSDSTAIRKRLSVSPQDYAAAELPAGAVLEAGDTANMGERDPFREPSEASPLPPRPLPFPRRAPFLSVAPPLRPGPAARAYGPIRLPGGVIEQVSLGREGGSGDAEGDPRGDAPGPASSDVGSSGGANLPLELQGSPERSRYDQVTIEGAKTWCFVRNADKHDLALRTNWKGMTITIDRVNVRSGRITVRNQQIEGGNVQSIQLAKTLRNEIERKVRQLDPSGASSAERRQLVRRLFGLIHTESWAGPMALDQAKKCVEYSQGGESSYRLLARALRETGDLRGETELFEQLPDRLEGSAFDLVGRARIALRLGLWRDAEPMLQSAIQKDPNDPWARLALVDFLRDEGRLGEVAGHLDASRRLTNLAADDDELVGLVEQLVDGYLAIGRLQSARKALTQMPNDAQFMARRSYLDGCVRYASGDFSGALESFRAAALEIKEAALAIGACQMARKDWAEAEQGLLAVTRTQPLLRDEAYAALALLYERTGNSEAALRAAESARSVNPTSSYVLYQVGRQSRLNGRLEAAADVLMQTLEASPQMVEALGELALVYLDLVERLGDRGDSDELAQYLYRARRCVDRMVALEQARVASGSDAVAGEVGRDALTQFVELQGLVRFQTANLGAAAASFDAEAGNSAYCRAGRAIVSYARNRVEDARNRLSALREELRLGDPLRQWSDGTLQKIADHGQKEQLRDSFDRDDLGRAWTTEGKSLLEMVDGTLRVRGSLPTNPVSATRSVQKGQDFLSAEVDIQAVRAPRLAVLQLASSSRRNASTPDFRVRVGLRDGNVFLEIHDGDRQRAQEKDQIKWEPVPESEFTAPVDDSASRPHRLALIVEPIEEGSRQRQIRVLWDGVEIYQREIKRLGLNSVLDLSLLVTGVPATRADVAFDNFRLVRRKPKE